MAKITWADKVDAKVSVLPAANKVIAADMNEIKTVVNGLDDSIISLTASKQDLLVSGTNIKTVNGNTLLGSGDVSVQPVLVSGTNIKTINGSSLLGAGNITISSSSLYTGSDTVPSAVVATLTDTLSFSGGTLIVEGADTLSTSTAFKIYDGDTTPNSLWDFRNNGDIIQGADATFDLNGNNLTFDISSSDYILTDSLAGDKTFLKHVNTSGSFNVETKLTTRRSGVTATKLENTYSTGGNDYTQYIQLRPLDSYNINDKRVGGVAREFDWRLTFNNQGNSIIKLQYDHRPSSSYIQSLNISGTYTASNYLRIFTNYNYALDPSNNVDAYFGIGVSPTEKLHVGENAKIDGTLELQNGLKNLGYTSSTAAPTTTELPADKNYSIHKDTSAGTVYLAYNDGGVIKTVTLT